MLCAAELEFLLGNTFYYTLIYSRPEIFCEIKFGCFSIKIAYMFSFMLSEFHPGVSYLLV
jgi:hypothetical protein